MGEPVTVYDSLKLGVAEIDEDHQKIAMLLNLLADAVELGDRRTIDLLMLALVGKCAEHFLKEERVMASAGCPGAADHVRSHDDARRILGVLQKELLADSDKAGEVVEKLKTFFVDVLLAKDLECRRFLEQCRL